MGTPRTTDRHDATLAPSADASAVGDAMTAYLRDVRAQAERYPLLSQEEERTLIARIRAGMFRPGCGIYGPPTPDALAAYEHFVGANLRLVVARAATQARTAQTLTLPDLVQAGNLGMLTALWKFDPNRGHKFSTYATAWIRQAIQRERQTHDRLIALPVHVQERRHPQARVDVQGRLILPPDARSYDRPANLAERDGERANLRAVLAAPGDFAEAVGALVDDETLRAGFRLVCAGILSERERVILWARFGFDGLPDGYGGHGAHGPGATLDVVGTRLGITRERVRQVEAKALRKLRTVLRLDAATGALGIDEAAFVRLCAKRRRQEEATPHERAQAQAAHARAAKRAKDSKTSKASKPGKRQRKGAA